MPPLLYSYRRCPYAMRARMALLWAGIPFDVFEIELRNKAAGLIQASSKATVPVLVSDTGTVLDQSWDIVCWALTHPRAADGCAEAWARSQNAANAALLTRNDGDFKSLIDRYKYPERSGAVNPQDRAACMADARHRAMCDVLLPLEQRLGRHPFLGGTAACATDIGLFPFVRQFAAVDRLWFDAQPLPHLQTWIANWAASALFAQTMFKPLSNQRQPFPVMPKA